MQFMSKSRKALVQCTFVLVGQMPRSQKHRRELAPSWELKADVAGSLSIPKMPQGSSTRATEFHFGLELT